MSSVYQEWFHKMPWKMQSILSNGLRAPDTKTSTIKKMVRWLRTQICNDADPTKPDCYMSAPTPDVALIQECGKELEYQTCHYVHHLADAMRIVAIYHPDRASREIAYALHFHVAEEIFHFLPETDEVFIYRHCDKVEHA